MERIKWFISKLYTRKCQKDCKDTSVHDSHLTFLGRKHYT